MYRLSDLSNSSLKPLCTSVGLVLGSLLSVSCTSNNDVAEDLVGDDVRRLVLVDIGEDIMLPALRDFAARAQTMDEAVMAHAQAPDDLTLRQTAQEAWREAMLSWQYLEPLQVGPSGASSGLDGTRGGADLRQDIYSYPDLNRCTVEELASLDIAVTAGSSENTRGLGAVEYLLYNSEENPCALETPASIAQRAEHAAGVTASIHAAADDLLQRWEPDGGNFIGEWNTAGIGSDFYVLPQNALNALSVALFYLDKQTKDLKIADPTGIGASGLEACDSISCPERLESRLSGLSGDNIRRNLQLFHDVFNGVDDGLGLNELLRGIGRGDLADKLIGELQTAFDHLDNMQQSFDQAVENITDAEACINGTANPGPEAPEACALHGYVKAATDTFRGSIVAVLSLTTPDSIAGDND